MKKIISLFAVLFVVGMSVQSQSKEALLNIPQAKGVNSGNVAFIMQVGVSNNASVKQEGVGNYASVLQNGQNNEATVQHDGDSNKTFITQNGDNNSAISELAGGDTEFINQQGDNNSNQTVKYGNARPGAQTVFVQQGNNHSVTYVQYEGAPGVKVEQKGNAGSVLIKQGRIGSF